MASRSSPRASADRPAAVCRGGRRFCRGCRAPCRGGLRGATGRGARPARPGDRREWSPSARSRPPRAPARLEAGSASRRCRPAAADPRPTRRVVWCGLATPLSATPVVAPSRAESVGGSATAGESRPGGRADEAAPGRAYLDPPIDRRDGLGSDGGVQRGVGSGGDRDCRRLSVAPGPTRSRAARTRTPRLPRPGAQQRH